MKFSTRAAAQRFDYFKISTMLLGTAVGGTLGYQYLSDSRAGVYSLLMPILHLMDAEDAHKFSIKAAKFGLFPSEKQVISDPKLSQIIWNKQLDNPIGLAAGYDKNAEAIDSMLGLGFGYVEVGSITPLAQQGNARPRFFRLPEDEAVINRYGFNSEGHIAALHRLQQRIRGYLLAKGKNTVRDTLDVPNSLIPGRILAVNLGKNKTSPADSHADYISGIQTLGPYADVIVINISSPNTPGLRALQRREPITELLSVAKSARNELTTNQPPLLVKIAPDCSDTELEDIAAVVTEVGVDGIIISNTTVSRPETLKSDKQTIQQIGGLSGKPLKPLALATVSKFYELTNGKIPIVGAGGISSADDVIEFAKAGASIVQIYTAFGYKGPGLIHQIKRDLLDRLQKENKTWTELIGCNHK